MHGFITEVSILAHWSAIIFWSPQCDNMLLSQILKCIPFVLFDEVSFDYLGIPCFYMGFRISFLGM